MLPLAKLWTFTGQSFIPFAAAWIYSIRNGLNEGALITRAYFGLLITLAITAALIWSLALYVRAAKAEHLPSNVPPNTTFEDIQSRKSILSWGTLVAFFLAVAVSLVAFGARYSESRVYNWDAKTPLASSFLESRKIAYRTSCSEEPCFAMSRRGDANCETPVVVGQYIPFLTDEALVLLVALCCAGGVFLAFVLAKRSRTRGYEL